MLTLLKSFLESGSFRRAATGIATSIAAIIVPVINQKFEVGLTENMVVAIIGGLVTNAGIYIAQSMSNEKHARESAAAAVKAVQGTDPAVDLARAPKP